MKKITNYVYKVLFQENKTVDYLEKIFLIIIIICVLITVVFFLFSPIMDPDAL